MNALPTSPPAYAPSSSNSSAQVLNKHTPSRSPTPFGIESIDASDAEQEEQDWLNEEDFGEPSQEGRAPLLTDIQAPAVLFAEGLQGHFDSPKSTLRMAFFNMANRRMVRAKTSIIGAGIIGLPYAFRQAGLLAGVLMLLMLTILVDWTIRLIVINSKLSGANSYQATVSACYGRPGLIAISLAQWAFAFGGIMAFAVIIGDTIPHVTAALIPNLEQISVLSWLGHRRVVIFMVVMGISYPLSLFRDISNLAKASAMALVSMVVIIATVVTEGPQMPSEMKGHLTSSNTFINSGFFHAIGVISFAFVCHHNSLLIYGSLRKPTLDRFSMVTHWSTGISMVACLIMALCGFITFGDKTQGNVLNNFPGDISLVNVARLCFGINMLTTIPLEAFVCREVIMNYFFPNLPFNLRRHVICTTALIASAMVISLFTTDLGVVLEFVGSTSACALAYILPPLCFIRLSNKGWKQKIPAGCCIVFGVAVMCISTVQSVFKVLG